MPFLNQMKPVYLRKVKNYPFFKYKTKRSRNCSSELQMLRKRLLHVFFLLVSFAKNLKKTSHMCLSITLKVS